jgi:hypothetical protein
MVVEHTMDVSGWLRKRLEEASPDLKPETTGQPKSLARAARLFRLDSRVALGSVRRTIWLFGVRPLSGSDGSRSCERNPIEIRA